MGVSTFLRPYMGLLRSQIDGSDPPISTPILVLLGGFQLILWGLLFKFTPVEFLEADALLEADPAIRETEVISGFTKFDVIRFIEVFLLALNALLVIKMVVNPLIRMAFDTLPSTAQSVSGALIGKTMSGADSQQNRAKPFSKSRKRIGLAVVTAVSTAITVLSLLWTRSFGPRDRSTKSATSSGSSNVPDPELAWGLTKLELINLSEVGVLCVVAFLTVILVIRPLVMKAFEAIPESAFTRKDANLVTSLVIVISAVIYAFFFLPPYYPIIAKVQIP